MFINWKYSEENKLWSLYINDKFMGVFDRYEYDKQRNIFAELNLMTVTNISS